MNVLQRRSKVFLAAEQLDALPSERSVQLYVTGKSVCGWVFVKGVADFLLSSNPSFSFADFLLLLFHSRNKVWEKKCY